MRLTSFTGLKGVLNKVTNYPFSTYTVHSLLKESDILSNLRDDNSMYVVIGWQGYEIMRDINELLKLIFL